VTEYYSLPDKAAKKAYIAEHKSGCTCGAKLNSGSLSKWLMEYANGLPKELKDIGLRNWERARRAAVAKLKPGKVAPEQKLIAAPADAEEDGQEEDPDRAD
jgi:hypothetical protein